MIKKLFVCLLFLFPNHYVLAEDSDVIEEVIVTGSRIQKTNAVALSPMTQINAAEIVYQGTVRVEDTLRKMPQIWVGNDTGDSNGATGTATVNLRHLGDVRTLVLLNGRRMPVGSPIQGGTGADINQIPGALIETVDVTTGGASAVYGSDAVAGVINFRMKSNFEGIALDTQWSQYSHDNNSGKIQDIVDTAGFPFPSGNKSGGEMTDFSLIIGSNLEDGRGNITAYMTYRDINAVLQSERDYSACALDTAITRCFGSGTIPEGRITDFGIGDGFDFKVEGTNFVPRDGTVFNYGPLNYFQRPDERVTAGSFAHYDINDDMEAYMEFMFTDDRSVSQIAPSGAFFITNELPCGNPLLSAQQFDQLCGQFGLTVDDVQFAYLGRRNVEGGPRQQDLRHTTYRGVFGLRGDLTDNWRYDVYAQYSEVNAVNTYLNDLSKSRIKKALNAVTDTEGNIVCQSVVDGTDTSCVPWNVFETGAVTQDMIDYLVLPLFARGTTDQTVLSAYVAGELMTVPGSENAVDAVFGIEYREENLEYNPDRGFRDGDGAGQGGATNPIQGGYDVWELFTEVSIPIIQDRLFAEDVTLDISYRYSDYSTGKTTSTYGFRAGWALNDQIKVRASFQRAIRAANVRELFASQGFNLYSMTGDPCSGAVTDGLTEAGRSLAECALSGVTAAQFGTIPDSPAEQYNFLQGGNPDLDPEKANTVSFGFIWTPLFDENLMFTVDYYDIEIKDGISNLDPEFILNTCLDGDLDQCTYVRRGQAGDLWIGSDVNTSGRISALQNNLAIERVTGIDFIADYTVEIGEYGLLEFQNITAMIYKWDQQELTGAPKVSCKGKWGSVCGSPTPDFQNNLRATWISTFDLTVSVLWRHSSKVKDLGAGEIDLKAVDYIDLVGTYAIGEKATLTVGTQNLFDVTPPIAGSGGANGNIFPGNYDGLGRYFFVRASLML